MNLLLKSKLIEILPEKMTGSGYIFISQRRLTGKYVGRKSCKKQQSLNWNKLFLEKDLEQIKKKLTSTSYTK